MRPQNSTKVVEIYGVKSDDGKHNFVIRKHSDGTISATEFKKSTSNFHPDRWAVVRDARAGERTDVCKCKCCCCK